MGYLIRVQVGLSLNWVIFPIKWHFGSIQFGSSELRFWLTSGQSILGPIRLSCKNKQFCREFRISYGSVRAYLSFESTFRWIYFKYRVILGLKSSKRNDVHLNKRIRGMVMDMVHMDIHWIPVVMAWGGYSGKLNRLQQSNVIVRTALLIKLAH